MMNSLDLRNTASVVDNYLPRGQGEDEQTPERLEQTHYLQGVRKLLSEFIENCVLKPKGVESEVRKGKIARKLQPEKLNINRIFGLAYPGKLPEDVLKEIYKLKEKEQKEKAINDFFNRLLHINKNEGVDIHDIHPDLIFDAVRSIFFLIFNDRGLRDSFDPIRVLIFLRIFIRSHFSIPDSIKTQGSLDSTKERIVQEIQSAYKSQLCLALSEKLKVLPINSFDNLGRFEKGVTIEDILECIKVILLKIAQKMNNEIKEQNLPLEIVVTEVMANLYSKDLINNMLTLLPKGEYNKSVSFVNGSKVPNTAESYISLNGMESVVKLLASEEVFVDPVYIKGIKMLINRWLPEAEKRLKHELLPTKRVNLWDEVYKVLWNQLPSVLDKVVDENSIIEFNQKLNTFFHNFDVLFTFWIKFTNSPSGVEVKDQPTEEKYALFLGEMFGQLSPENLIDTIFKEIKDLQDKFGIVINSFDIWNLYSQHLIQKSTSQNNSNQENFIRSLFGNKSSIIFQTLLRVKSTREFHEFLVSLLDYNVQLVIPRSSGNLPRFFKNAGERIPFDTDNGGLHIYVHPQLAIPELGNLVYRWNGISMGAPYKQLKVSGIHGNDKIQLLEFLANKFGFGPRAVEGIGIILNSIFGSFAHAHHDHNGIILIPDNIHKAIPHDGPSAYMRSGTTKYVELTKNSKQLEPKFYFYLLSLLQFSIGE